jgi:spore coat protein CotF
MCLFWFISSLFFDELFLHVVENISLTYAKFSCSFFFTIDSCFSHVMTPCTILGSPKVCIFLSDLLLMGTLNKGEVFDKMVKLTRC